MSGNGKLGLAVVGCGMAAKPHAKALRELADIIEVKGVHSRSTEKARAFAKEHGFPVAEELEVLADEPDIQAVLILTPPNARDEPVSLFSSKGKHILSEKPVERNLAAATRIVETCEEAGVMLGIVFQHRFRQGSVELARRLKAGELGEIRSVRAEVPWWREQAYYDEPGRGSYERDGGGVLISQAIHTLDLMLSLAGPVARVQALAATTAFHDMESEDFVAAGLEFESGAVGSLMATTAGYPGDPESIRLDCDKASATLQSGTLTVNWREPLTDGSTREEIGEPSSGTGGGADPMAFPADWHRDLIANFARSVRGDEELGVTGRAALEVHRLIAALETSSREGKRVAVAGLT